MLELSLEETASTPKVIFSASDNTLNIEGRLLPEHPGPFFEKLYDWLESALAENLSEVKISFYLYYYNTTSTKRLVMFLQEIAAKMKAGLNASVDWKYDEEDEDAHDDGVDFQKATGIDIKLISIEEDE